jgi:endonuclease G
MKKRLFIFLVMFPILLLGQIKNVNIELGIPIDTNPKDDYLIYRTQYVLSFNPNLHVANWVSWNLNKNWYGGEDRSSGFKSDPKLPKNIYQATNNDYKGTVYDKGHTVASEERTATEEDNLATFYYTNAMPQYLSLNRGVWKSLEAYCKKLCENNNKELYVIAGGIYHKGHKNIGKDVAVPDSCFKIIVVLNYGEKLTDVNNETTVIAVVMPNDKSVKGKKWFNYITTVRRIEWSTGYNFLTNIPKNIQNSIEIEKFKF